MLKRIFQYLASIDILRIESAELGQILISISLGMADNCLQVFRILFLQWSDLFHHFVSFLSMLFNDIFFFCSQFLIINVNHEFTQKDLYIPDFLFPSSLISQEAQLYPLKVGIFHLYVTYLNHSFLYWHLLLKKLIYFDTHKVLNYSQGPWR